MNEKKEINKLNDENNLKEIEGAVEKVKTNIFEAFKEIYKEENKSDEVNSSEILKNTENSINDFFSNFNDFLFPTKEEIIQNDLISYKSRQESLNNFSYWFPKIKNCGFTVPKSAVMPINFEWYEWLQSDSYKEDEVNEFSKCILSFLNDFENDLNLNEKLFIKTNDFSNKFEFSTCEVNDINNIAKQFVDVNYGALLVGAQNATELVIRQFIDSDSNIPTIYNGMPLNTEYRIFYDFDNHSIIDILNYWDVETMEDGLKYNLDDLETFKKYKNILVANFEKYKNNLSQEVNEKLSKITNLNGIWSVDFMIDSIKLKNNELYFILIDMALAENSYYYEKIVDKL